MIDNNIIKFGYGTILVDSNEFTRTVILKYIQPPKEIGKSLSKEDLQDVIVIDKVAFHYKSDMDEFYKKLCNVNEDNTMLEFRGYTFDFSVYNEGSLKAVKEGFKIAIRGWIRALAC